MAAVEDYVTAFNIAEAEAKRRRRTDFTPEGQQRIARAENLLRVASDSAATPQERQNAYDRACKELDGLVVLPAATQASIERGISGELGGKRGGFDEICCTGDAFGRCRHQCGNLTGPGDAVRTEDDAQAGNQ